MKKIFIFFEVISIVLLFDVFSFAKYNVKSIFTEKKPFILLDFDNKAEVNNVNGSFGKFDANPDDKNAYIRYEFKKDKSLHFKGYNLYVMYDVDSPKPAFNGLWTKLNGINLKKFKAISITIKGDTKTKFNPFFKIELKTKKAKITAVVEKITDSWKKIVIPFEDFEGDSNKFDFSNLDEFTIVFEDWKFQQKVGAYYIDDIAFIPEKGKRVKFKDILK